MKKFLIELHNKLKKILLEATNVSSNEVMDAINNQNRVLITYDDETKYKKTGLRLIEPYVYGLTNAGNEAIRAFQYYGATRRGVPKYKLFRLDRIKSWKVKDGDKFVAEPKKLAIAAPDYNEDGDGSMSMIFAQVKFSDENNNADNSQPQNNEPTEWESPLDKIRRERQKKQDSIERQLNNKININKSGAIQTKSLEKELESGKGDLEQDLDVRLGFDTDNSNRGAVSVNADRYDKDSRSPEEKHDAEIMRRRDKRWEKAADSRQLYRKGSANDDLRKQDEKNNE